MKFEHSIITLSGLLKGIVQEVYVSNQTTEYFVNMIASLFPAETHVKFIERGNLNIIKIDYFKDERVSYCFAFKCDGWNEKISKNTVNKVFEIGNGPLLKK